MSTLEAFTDSKTSSAVQMRTNRGAAVDSVHHYNSSYFTQAAAVSRGRH